MIFNIHYEIAAALFLIVFFIFHKKLYKAPTMKNTIFRQMLIIIFIGNLFDALSAITISYAQSLPVWVNIVTNTLYFIVAPSSTFFLFLYAAESSNDTRAFRAFLKVNRIVSLLYSAAIIVNIFTGFVFYFDSNHIYTHGPVYFLIYVVAIFYLVTAVAYVIICRNRYTTREIVYLGIYILVCITGSALQLFLLRDTLLNFFTAAIAIVFLMFTMETSDYYALMELNEELNKSHKELVEARNLAEEAMKNAEAANLAKSRFLANMSHEIRTPINGILGINEIARNENTDPIMEEHLEDIRSAGESLLAILNDILDVSKIESGKMEIVPANYDVSSLIYDCYSMVSIRAANKKLELEVINNPTLPVGLYGDEIRIRQIILNLLTNAIKYTNEGKVSFILDYDKIDATHINLLITVQDTGIGITEEDCKRLFQNFSRVDMEHNHKIEGTGLGLQLVKDFSELMGGEVYVDSIYGTGSTFRVRIPQLVFKPQAVGVINVKARNTHEVTETPTELHFPAAKVLVVDDVAMNLKVFCGLLKKTELQVDTATSGDECIRKMQEQQYDLVFLDHMMPEKDGIETLNELKDMSPNPNHDTPIIVLTANAIQGAREDYLNLGFTDYLSKPIDSKKLKEMLAHYLKA